MPTKTILPEIGSKYGKWEILETGLINPNTKNKYYIGKPVFSKCKCTQCNKTILLKNNSELNRAAKGNSACKHCASMERIKAQRDIKIGNKFGKLTVIGDGGVKNERHYSICECECGKITIVKDNSLKTGQVRSCGCLGSIGENEISKILKENNIIFDHDKIFPELLQKTGRRLRFDFIIYNKDGSLNRFVEFDGNQHKTGMWGGTWSNLEPLEVIKERDNIKNNFCLINNYTLVRIPYSKRDRITLNDILGDNFIYKGEKKENGKTKGENIL